MKQAGEVFYDSIKNYSDLEKLVLDGESENLFLECKSPLTPTLSADLRKTLAKALSGFSNTNGGVIIWGASTTNKTHSGLDVITQIEPIGNCNKFQREIENRIPMLTIPAITEYHNKIIKKKPTDTRGVLLTYIPKRAGDPIQNAEDEYFYFRSGAEFVKTPYEMIKRLFSANESPDLTVEFDSRLIKMENNVWNFPLCLCNNSSAAAEKIKVFVIVENFEECEEFHITNFRDNSHINPQYKKALMYDVNEVVYKGLNLNIGDVKAKLKGKKRSLTIKISLYANKMIGKEIKYKIYLIKKMFRTMLLEEKYKY
jgi:hypothetical protein